MDLKKATIEELAKYSAQKREELRRLRFSVAGSKNANVKLAQTLRKEIARTETEMTAKRT